MHILCIHKIMQRFRQPFSYRIINKKQFQNEVLKFFFVLWRYMILQISMSFAQLFWSIYAPNEPVRFDLTNVERGPRSNFWDHSQHFRTNGFRVIAPNRANFRVKWLNRANFWVNFWLSCSHLKTKRDIDI